MAQAKAARGIESQIVGMSDAQRSDPAIVGRRNHRLALQDIGQDSGAGCFGIRTGSLQCGRIRRDLGWCQTSLRCPLAHFRRWHRERPRRTLAISYKLNMLPHTEVTFVLTSGGHSAGIVSELGHPCRSYQMGMKRDCGNSIAPNTWSMELPKKEGVWWVDWVARLDARFDERIRAPAIGNADSSYAAHADAPETFGITNRTCAGGGASIDAVGKDDK